MARARCRYLPKHTQPDLHMKNPSSPPHVQTSSAGVLGQLPEPARSLLHNWQASSHVAVTAAPRVDAPLRAPGTAAWHAAPPPRRGLAHAVDEGTVVIGPVRGPGPMPGLTAARGIGERTAAASWPHPYPRREPRNQHGAWKEWVSLTRRPRQRCRCCMCGSGCRPGTATGATTRLLPGCRLPPK